MFSDENDPVGAANQSVVSISDDGDNSDVVFVEASNAIDKKEDSNASGYLAEADSSSSSSISFESPPDYTEYLKLLYAGEGQLIPDKSLRPPLRDNKDI